MCDDSIAECGGLRACKEIIFLLFVDVVGDRKGSPDRFALSDESIRKSVLLVRG